MPSRTRFVFDLLMDRAGERLGADWIADQLSVLDGGGAGRPGRRSVSASLSSVSEPHARSGRRLPFYWWRQNGGASCYAMKPVVARLFREARQNAGDARAGAARAGVMTVPTGNVRGRIFMSYRREETAYPAGWLFDRLARQFGRQQVFKDVDSIELGDDFVEVITTAVESCDVLLALIGGRWLTIAGQDGRRRLDDPGDFVRLEIEAALARQVRVIPVLVDGARMPRAEELPPSLAKLTRRQALELSPVRFDADTQRLLRVLQRVITEAQEQAGREADRVAADVPRQERERRQKQSQERAATKDGNAVMGMNDELAALDLAAADAGSPASARDQITRRGEAERTGARFAPEDAVASVSAGEEASAIREVLAALVERGGKKVQTIYDALIDLGYVPGVPAPRPDGTRQLYVGWSDPARPEKGKTKFTLYLESRIVSFGRVTDRRKVADLPGADTSPGAYVAFRLNAPDSVDRALAAARAVKR